MEIFLNLCDGKGWGKLAEKVGRREIYHPVPPPSRISNGKSFPCGKGANVTGEIE